MCYDCICILFAFSLAPLMTVIESDYCMRLYAKCSNGLKPPTIVGILRVLNCWVKRQILKHQTRFSLKDGLDRYQRVRMEAFMRYIRIEMQRGVLENDATAEALEQLL